MTNLKYLLTLALTTGITLSIISGCSCSCDNGKSSDSESDSDAPYQRIARHIEKSSFKSVLVSRDSVDRYGWRGIKAPDEGCVKLHINNPGYLAKTFNDSNNLHIEEARKIGIKPLESAQDAWEQGVNLVRVSSCKDFYLDSLTHSHPYLVPEAYSLLHRIGTAFNDSLAARGGGGYRIKVTSLTRTPALVKKLRRINRNSVEESAHNFGTTFDISFSKFNYNGEGPHRTFEDLKNLLGEILVVFRNEGMCYVKYERRQSCFHITVRSPQKV